MTNIPQGNQPLPKKETNLLRQVVKNYESKQYAKGIKTAELILKKFPEHGETMAMKGLILNCLGRKDEAYDFVNRGLRSDVKSHICWHVYGLLYRSDRDYKKAISCYLNALKHDKENSQILRDLGLLQIQMRDLNGFLETRHRLLQQRPNNRNNWISFSIAHYLNRNLDVAIQVLEAYEETLEQVPKEEEYEHSEMMLFKIKMLDENGKKSEALELLESSKKSIKDRLVWLEIKGKLLLDIQKPTEAYEIYKKLININSENYDYHKGFLKTLGIKQRESNESYDDEELKRLSEIYEELQMEHSHSRCCKRIPLDFKRGENFVKAVEMYIVEYIVKGIPSLFSDLKPLYKNDDKTKSIELLFETYLEELISNNHSHTNNTCNSKLNLECLEKIKSSPQSVVWVLHYLAQHYDAIGHDFDKALDLNQRAIDHTPTIAELYLARSKILKHAGDLIGSYMAANNARKLDLADRYLNCIAVKASFRINLVKRAEYLAALFTKNGNEIENLVEMQCTWFEIVSGHAYRRKGNYGKALKQYLAVINHYEDFVEDQFDFHGYCIRKMTLRSYIDMLEMEDKIHKEKSYIKAACGAIQCYLELHDNKDIIDVTEGTKEMKIEKNEKSNVSKTSSEDSKRPESSKKKKKHTDNSMSQTSEIATVDPDPNGKKLLECEALVEADKYVKMLRKHASDQFISQQLGFEVYMRKNKLLLALSCVKRGLELNGPRDPEIHQMIVTFSKKVEEEGINASNGEANVTTETTQDDVCHEILKEEIQILLNGQTIETYNENYFELCKDQSYVCYAIYVQMKILLNPDKKSEIIEEFSKNEFLNLFEKMSLKDAIRIHGILNSKIIDDAEIAEKWKLRCSKKFVYATYFDGAQQTVFKNDQHGNIIVN